MLDVDGEQNIYIYQMNVMMVSGTGFFHALVYRF